MEKWTGFEFAKDHELRTSEIFNRYMYQRLQERGVPRTAKKYRRNLMAVLQEKNRRRNSGVRWDS